MEDIKFIIDNTWVLLSALLVFIMHLGFSSLEVGLTRQKNTVNVLFKNLFIISIGLITYALIGFNTMYPGELFNGWLSIGGPIGFTDDTANLTKAYADYTYWTDFLFQAMFAATGATIVSGAVAERVKLSSFLLFATLLVAIAYPISGAWKWGGGFLDKMGFYDFAGSSVVHAFGGFAALACAWLLGPRADKYKDGKVNALPGHSMPLVAIGVFLLWFGWYGFNGGSVLSADPASVSFVCVTTSLSAAAGALSAMLFSWVKSKKPDYTMTANGVLAGLVGITAGADVVSIWSACIIGAIAGIILCLSSVFIERVIKIDDPIGAIAVHGVCGIWGTVAVGIFSTNPDHSILIQLAGALIISSFSFLFSLLVFGGIKKTLGIRINGELEAKGLDLLEHGHTAYPDFQVS
jgi:Amt family ammonium transporter|tara:strand:+ start:7272 stop:8492 length:1221 start_codon:yes stop_codon:yes gene_type:complete